MAKISPGRLQQILAGLAPSQHPSVVVGMRHPDDAGVVRTPSGDLLVQTLDVITPIVNDPASFGRIAAANALSDVYAMGGKPLAAMSIACFPAKAIEVEVLQTILRGAQATLEEAACPLVGGHTVADEELKLGFSISGICGRDVLSIDRARPGDLLVLCKPLGTGVVNKAIRDGSLPDDSAEVRAATASMIALNASPSGAALLAGAHAATDITGFGLIGHSAQFARASGVTFEIERSQVPALPGVRELIARGVFAGRARDNRLAYEGRWSGGLSDQEAALLCDPQTSGGLLVSLPPAGLDVLRRELSGWAHGVAVIGRVVGAGAADLALI